MYEDHLKTCDYCQKGVQTHKPTLYIKAASSYYEQKKPTIYIKSPTNYHRQKKLTELGAIIKGTSYPTLEPMFQPIASNILLFAKTSPFRGVKKVTQVTWKSG